MLERIKEAARSLWQGLLGSIASTFQLVITAAVERPWQRFGMAVARILLGVSALGVLLTNFIARYYVYGSGAEWMNAVYGDNAFTRMPLFSAFRTIHENDTMFTLVYLATALLAAAYTVGWRTRFVTFPLWFLYLGLIQLSNPITGQVGDLLWRIFVLALFFSQAHLTWSLDARRIRKAEEKGTLPLGYATWNRICPQWFQNVLHNAMLVFLIGQLSIQYVTAALYKNGDTWINGTAVYLSLQIDSFRVFPQLSDFLGTSALVVGVLTYATILIQVLFPGLLLARPTRTFALVSLIAFHVGIAVLMGLVWFSLTMIAIDLVLVSDRTWDAIRRWAAALFGKVPAPNRIDDICYVSDEGLSQTAQIETGPRSEVTATAEVAEIEDATEANGRGPAHTMSSAAAVGL